MNGVGGSAAAGVDGGSPGGGGSNAGGPSRQWAGVVGYCGYRQGRGWGGYEAEGAAEFGGGGGVKHGRLFWAVRV